MIESGYFFFSSNTHANEINYLRARINYNIGSYFNIDTSSICFFLYLSIDIIMIGRATEDGCTSKAYTDSRNLKSSDLQFLHLQRPISNEFLFVRPVE